MNIALWIFVAFLVIGGGWLYREMKRTPLSTKPWKPGDE